MECTVAGIRNSHKAIRIVMVSMYGIYVRFELFTAVTMKNGVSWVVRPYFFTACVGC
jgi:hypothetical protein